MIYPHRECIKQVELNEKNRFLFGGDIYNLTPSSLYKVSRLTHKSNPQHATSLSIKCIDDTTPIHMMSRSRIYTDMSQKLAERSYATLVIEPPLTEQEQCTIAFQFNALLMHYRLKYKSLFLSHFREYKRKRISFDLVYSITSYLLKYINIHCHDDDVTCINYHRNL